MIWQKSPINLNIAHSHISAQMDNLCHLPHPAMGCPLLMCKCCMHHLDHLSRPSAIDAAEPLWRHRDAAARTSCTIAICQVWQCVLCTWGQISLLTPQNAHVLRLPSGEAACDVGVACRPMDTLKHTLQASGSQGLLIRTVTWGPFGLRVLQDTMLTMCYISSSRLCHVHAASQRAPSIPHFPPAWRLWQGCWLRRKQDMLPWAVEHVPFGPATHPMLLMNALPIGSPSADRLICIG